MQRELSSKPHFYPHRQGVRLDGALETLQKPPLIELTDEERGRVLQVEATLTHAEDLNKELMVITPTSVRGVERIWRKEINSTKFFLDYMLTEEGLRHIKEVFGDEPELITLEEMKDFLYTREFSGRSTKQLDKLSGAGRGYAEERMVHQFVAGGFASTYEVEDPHAVTIIRNPGVLVQKTKEYRDLKNYLRAYERIIKENHSNEGLALQAITKMHKRRVNELIAGLYDEASHFLLQANHNPSPENVRLAHQISESLAAPTLISGPRRFRQLARLDRFMNGAGEWQKRNMTPISKEVEDLVEKMWQKGEGGQLATYRYKGQEELLERSIDAVTMQTWLKQVLGSNEYALLSKVSDQEYKSDREVRAQDDKWQVVISEKAASLAINSKQGVMKVPARFNRKLASRAPAGAIPVADHEVVHVIQHENKKRLGFSLTEQVGMDRSDVISEAGGILWEQEAQERLFGNARTVNPQYYAAAREKLQGGSLKDCAKGFFDSAMRMNPGSDRLEAMKLAVNRAMRLFRNGGDYTDISGYLTNSQPLVYVEQELLTRSLIEHNLEKLLLINGINIEMLSQLHQVGLLSLDSIWEPSKRPSEMLEDEIAKLLYN